MSENDVSRSGSERKCEDAPLAQTSSSWLLELHRRCFSCCNVVLRQEALLHGGHDRAMVRALEDMLCSTQIYVLSRSVVCRLLLYGRIATGYGQGGTDRGRTTRRRGGNVLQRAIGLLVCACLFTLPSCRITNVVSCICRVYNLATQGRETAQQ